MKELAPQNDENSSDCDSLHNPDDVFAKIMGKDKDGRLCIYGLGVKPNDIYGGRPSRDALYRKSMEEEEEMRALKKKVEELTALVNTILHSNGLARTAPVSSSQNQSLSSSISRPSRIRVGSYVKLKSLVNFSEFVATGILSAIGDVTLNGRDLGPGICEAVIQSILKKKNY